MDNKNTLVFKKKIGKIVIFTLIQLQFTTFQFHCSIITYYKIIIICHHLLSNNSRTISSASKNKCNKSINDKY